MYKIKPKNKFVALIFAFIFTGLGHIYIGKLKRGVLFLLIHIVSFSSLLIYFYHSSTIIHVPFLVSAGLVVLFEIYVLSDVYLLACREKYEKSSIWKNGWAILFLLCVIFVFNGHILLFSQIKGYISITPPEPSASMNPVLKKGDVFLVNKFVYRNTMPKQGDVVVFNYPHNPKKAFVKRVIAGENQQVEIKNGRIYINDVLDLIQPIGQNIYLNEGLYGGIGQVVRVPDGHYYVLGDNSQKSKDSRHWGFVDQSFIIGKAYKIIYPVGRSGPIY